MKLAFKRTCSARLLDNVKEVSVRTLLCAALVSFVAAATPAVGQDVVKKSKTKVSVDDGKEITATGCVARSGDKDFSLTNAAGKSGALGSYILVAEGDDRDELNKHVGHRVEIKGKAVDHGHGEMTVKTETELRTNEGDKKKRESTTKVKGDDLNGLPFLGVKSVRMLAAVCP
jgi:opacity protein-like surface antigen